MDRLIYTAMSGAAQALDRQAVVSNNMANASSTGFKQQMSMFRSVPVNGHGNPTRAITANTTPAANYANGSLQHTGRALDVAIDGSGWLAVQSPDGGEAYTRAGKLQQDATGVLRSQGNPVLGEGGQPIVVPLGAKTNIADDGTISALGAGDQPNTLSEVGKLKLVDPNNDDLERGGDGLFRRYTEGNQQPAPFAASDTVRVASETLESSNVKPSEAMMQMIGNSRRFEMQMQMISSAKENARSADQLLKVQ